MNVWIPGIGSNSVLGAAGVCKRQESTSLEVKLPTIWTDEKQRGEESERREE